MNLRDAAHSAKVFPGDPIYLFWDCCRYLARDYGILPKKKIHRSLSPWGRNINPAGEDRGDIDPFDTIPFEGTEHV